jgi:hypothetical protein
MQKTKSRKTVIFSLLEEGNKNANAENLKLSAMHSVIRLFSPVNKLPI